MQELENIDDEADQLGIGFVKIHDSSLADEYNLGDLPKLVYYRHQIPIVYERQWFVKRHVYSIVLYTRTIHILTNLLKRDVSDV